MRIQSLLIIFCSLFSGTAFAYTPPDSIGVENHNGKEIVLHQIESKETYYSLGRKYHVPVKTIMDYNSSKALQPGMVIKVPTSRPYGQAAQQTTLTAPVATPSAPSQELVEYKVGSGETLYALARRFGTTVGEIKELNNLQSNSLRLGQILKIKQGVPSQFTPAQPAAKPAPVSPPPAERQPTVITHPDTSSAAVVEAESVKQNRYGIRQQEEKGVAVWIEDENVDSTKMLALHNTVPAGTIIQVTNPMNGKSAFVKVIGRYTENESTKDVIIVFTKAVANVLGALDKRFQVSITYGAPGEN
jgi:LysM repeat protein